MRNIHPGCQYVFFQQYKYIIRKEKFQHHCRGLAGFGGDICLTMLPGGRKIESGGTFSDLPMLRVHGNQMLLLMLHQSS